MPSDIIHLHINSKNQQFNSITNTYNINLPPEFVKINTGDWFLQINNFYTIYNWYNLQKDYNDSYNIQINDIFVSNYTLKEGNPRVTDIIKILNTRHADIFRVSYDYMMKKLLFVNIAPNDNTITIEPLTCGKFLGLFDDKKMNVLTEGNYGDSVVNVSGDKSLLLHIQNADFVLANTSLDNLDED